MDKSTFNKETDKIEDAAAITQMSAPVSQQKLDSF
jgi:hypothetical protein